MKKAMAQTLSKDMTDLVSQHGGVLFRRVRGKIVPIRFKGQK